MSIDFELKQNYDISDLLRITQLLREPQGGCPWDKEQTHSSIKMNFVEETYEVVDAIQLNDAHLLCEELGDVLLQVALHTQMASEDKQFTFNDVCDGICKKLIYRHPHIFGDTIATTKSDVLNNWENLKQKEKSRNTVADNLNSVPKAFPALIRAQKLGKRAAVTGYDYKDAIAALDGLNGEILELKQALISKNSKEIEDEIGDALFSCVNVARLAKVNAEEALAKSCDKFTNRVIEAEKLALAQGNQLNELSEEKLDYYWEKAKITLK